MRQNSSRIVAVLLGGAVCISLTNVIGTVLFNAMTYVALGSGVPIANAVSRAHSSWSIAITYAAVVVAGVLGGYTAAALNVSRPYLNAALSGSVLILWYVAMLATPVQIRAFDGWSYVSWFVVPIPAAILGAYFRSLHRATCEDD